MDLETRGADEDLPGLDRDGMPAARFVQLSGGGTWLVLCCKQTSGRGAAGTWGGGWAWSGVGSGTGGGEGEPQPGDAAAAAGAGTQALASTATATATATGSASQQSATQQHVLEVRLSLFVEDGARGLQCDFRLPKAAQEARIAAATRSMDIDVDEIAFAAFREGRGGAVVGVEDAAASAVATGGGGGGGGDGDNDYDGGGGVRAMSSKANVGGKEKQAQQRGRKGELGPAGEDERGRRRSARWHERWDARDAN